MYQNIMPKIDFWNFLSPLDITIFCLVLVITAASVIYGQVLKNKALSKESNDEEQSFLDLLILGRQLTMPMFVATLVATWYGGIFGVTEIAFNYGVYNFVTQGAFWYIAYIIFAFFIIHKITPYKAVTLPDLVEKMFGPKSAKLTGIFNFFNVLPVAYTISLGLFLQLLFGGELVTNIALGTTFVVLYSMWGGFRAVVFSDIIQFFVMVTGVFLILAFSVSTFGGLGFLKENLPEAHFSLTGGQSWSTTFVWGFIALSTLVDPNFYQRCFAAVSEKAAKRGILVSTFIWFCFDICTTFGAMYARAVIPTAESQHAYMTYAIQILPDGLKGFVLAGILATILSTMDSYLFLAGTTLSYDLAPKRFKGKVKFHHLGIIIVGIISVIVSIIFKGDIKTVWKTLGSFSASCLLLPVIYGYIFPKKIKDNQFVFACLLGVITTAIWRNIERPAPFKNVDELYVGIITTSLGLAFYHLLNRKKEA
ncbi:sodium:solute symporter [Bacteriovorax sp. DB6_IX]|uniref:sodium:solute symporter family protein n=1 Tax=Bacteriovorax sp. DB6_IX TaxID=1353530 RepID=UPI00041193B0|nr:sodium:phosphate symporter [Bacteriovorax sp. DB6_IX]